MKSRKMLYVVAAAILTLAQPGALLGAARSDTERQKAHGLFKQGNRKEAYEVFRKLALDAKNDPKKVCSDFNMAIQCLRNLNRVHETDALREAFAKTQAGNWRALHAAAESYFQANHHGYIISGEFRRGHHRGGGRYVNAIQRDRVRALQLMGDALKKTKGEADKNALGNFHLAFARMILGYRGYHEAWRLQYLTDLGKLPDYDRGHYWGSRRVGTPVHPDGTPVFHKIPAGYAKAKTDGERWRWMLMQAMEVNPQLTNRVLWDFASFHYQQFGVQTMAQYGWFFRGRQERDDGRKDTSGTYELHTLKQTETIAKLATGIRRFTLPDEFNFIKIYKRIADQPATGYGSNAVNQLAGIFENRRQYDEAAAWWKRASNTRRVQQVLGNWGVFEPVKTHPAGKGAAVQFRFRNGSKVSFTAHRIRVKKLLDDVKAYLKSNPGRVDYHKVRISQIGYRLVQRNEKAYIGDRVAAWDLALKPRPKHFDRRITVDTPLQEPGAYLVTAQMDKGNTSRIILWVDDTVILKKPLSKQHYLFVGDARTGAPVARANVEFFGYRQERIRNTPRGYVVKTQNFAEFTDPDGQIILDPKRVDRHYRWLITATTPKGRFAYYGFTGVWYSNYYDREYNARKVYGITDRPVYRPKQSVKFKFWVRHAKYDQAETSTFAKQNFRVEVRSPKNEKVFTKALTTDAWGGVHGEFPLAHDTTLGVYSLQLWQGGRHWGRVTFRVEEYKKPEFEVTVDAPSEPVKLGEKIAATIKAKYYFGAPVVKAKVKYKILRSNHDGTWYPYGHWDWFYGPGYWWFSCDYTWYPGWREWGCPAPWPWWWHRSRTPPEVVAENEVEIGPDGTVKVEIDTGPAKEMHGDIDHKYEITAEVVDQSRRTIVGQGTVLVARRPFKVYTWVDRGYYTVGDTIRASLSAQTLDRKPVQGKGELRLARISYGKDGKPRETVVQEWDLDTDDEGRAAQQIKASRPGQYRLVYSLTDAKKHTIEGGYVFVIRGQGFDGRAFRFNDIEVVTDKREYKPGETVRLMVNTNQPDGTVLLFLRPSNGIYLPPKVIRLKGKSTVEQVAVVKRDMPNFFIEAITISNGRLHTGTREVIVPPEKRVLNIDVKPSKKTYKPGEKAKVKLKVTEFNGEPYAGSLVLAMYDRSVEYISGGSNVSEIKTFFWKWRRRHRANTQSTLDRRFGNLLRSGEIGMQYLGVFGRSVADDMDQVEKEESNGALGGARQRRADFAMGAVMEGKGGGAPMVAAAAPGRAMKKAVMSEAAADSAAAPGEPPPAAVQPTVRTKFADTAYWSATLAANTNGEVEIDLTMPENLTGWKIRTWAMGHGTRVGEATTEVFTKKNLLLRLQAPRFFVEKDEVVLSANVHNYLKGEKKAQVVLELDGPCLEAMTKTTKTVTIAPNGEERVDWRVRVKKEGEAVVRMKALTDEESDAMQMSFPVYVHGMLKTDSFCGVIRPKQTKGTVTIQVPKERRIDQSRLEVRYSPTLAGAMVDALPYLVEYPYGCTEQTLNRFLPTVMTQKVLLEMGLDLQKIKEKRTNLNAQEIGDDRERAKQWKRWTRNPVFDRKEVQAMVKKGVQRLTEMQLSDGGWGWFSGYGEHSWAHTTAYVVHGLQLARANDAAIVPGVIERGVAWLKRHQAREVQKIKNWPKQVHPRKRYADNLDAFVYMVLADAKFDHPDMREFLYRDRNHLAVYAKSMYGIACHTLGHVDKAKMLLRNIDQVLEQDDENQSAWLNLGNGGYWWYWYGSEYEAQAYYLKLLVRLEPKAERASRLVKYLLNNRKHATYWNSTRDTAVCVEAFADYLRATGEHKPDMTIEVLVDGKKHKEVKVNTENLFTFDNKFVLVGDAVESGKHTVELRKRGTGPLYFNAYLTNFTLEDFITKAGLEIKVNRAVYKLVKVDKKIKVVGAHGQALDQKVEKYERKRLANDAVLKSGDLVEIELTLESKNDYEYLVFEDMKAAGFEPVDLRSGYIYDSLPAYVEFRDNRVCFFVRRLMRGKHSVAYRMRAEIPGRFSALPTRGYAMYAPELKANSDEIKLRIED